jgi:predicted RNase H-like HicB family nuclease
MAKLKQKKNAARVPFTVEFDREEDGRWIAEVRELPGVMAYGSTKQAALRKVYAIALRTLADKAEEGRGLSSLSRLFTYELARR